MTRSLSHCLTDYGYDYETDKFVKKVVDSGPGSPITEQALDVDFSYVRPQPGNTPGGGGGNPPAGPQGGIPGGGGG